jgi:quercetin dioxygenase-like cupin family protein
MNQPTVQVNCVSNLFARMMYFEKAGDKELGHTHAFDHLTLLAKGKLSVKINGQVTEFQAPQMIFIKAELNHELTALTDGTVAYCIHALRDSSGDIIDPASVPQAEELTALMNALVNPT